MLKLDLSNLEGAVSQQELDALAPELEAAHAKLYDPAAPGAELWTGEALPLREDGLSVRLPPHACAAYRFDGI